MRLVIFFFMICAVGAAEQTPMTQAEQDAAWAKAMEESAAIKATQPAETTKQESQPEQKPKAIARVDQAPGVRRAGRFSYQSQRHMDIVRGFAKAVQSAGVGLEPVLDVPKVERSDTLDQAAAKEQAQSRAGRINEAVRAIKSLSDMLARPDATPQDLHKAANRALEALWMLD